MDKQNCFNCRFFLSFTPTEATSFRTKLAEQGLQGNFFGGCTYKSCNNPFVIRRYLAHPINRCNYWQQGDFQEQVGETCPQCKKGQVVIRRPVKDKQTYTMIGCSRHPDCKFRTQYLPLKTSCRFCTVPLMLGTGEQLSCYCPQCKRRIVVPLSVESWSHVFRVGKTCPHDLTWGNCEVCNCSQTEKRDVIDIELVDVAQYWLQKKAYKEKIRTFFNHSDDDYDEDEEYYNNECLMTQTWMEQFSEGFTRSNESGCFYPD